VLHRLAFCVFCISFTALSFIVLSFIVYLYSVHVCVNNIDDDDDVDNDVRKAEGSIAGLDLWNRFS